MRLSSDVCDHRVTETLSVASGKHLLGSSPLPRGGGPGPWQAWLLPPSRSGSCAADSSARECLVLGRPRTGPRGFLCRRAANRTRCLWPGVAKSHTQILSASLCKGQLSSPAFRAPCSSDLAQIRWVSENTTDRNQKTSQMRGCRRLGGGRMNRWNVRRSQGRQTTLRHCKNGRRTRVCHNPQPVQHGQEPRHDRGLERTCRHRQVFAASAVATAAPDRRRYLQQAARQEAGPGEASALHVPVSSTRKTPLKRRLWETLTILKYHQVPSVRGTHASPSGTPRVQTGAPVRLNSAPRTHVMCNSKRPQTGQGLQTWVRGHLRLCLLCSHPLALRILILFGWFWFSAAPVAP